MSKKKLSTLAGYAGLLKDIKSRIQQAQTRAMLSVNAELVRLYWDVGRLIVERQHREGWGASVIDRLAADLQKAFPELKGFSPSNVSRMRAFYLAYRPDAENLSPIVARPLLGNSARAVPKAKARNSAHAVPKLESKGPPPLMAAIPWGHNVVLLFKLSDNARRLWYANQTLAHGWSRAVLTVQIELDLYERQGKAITNFDRLLPSPQSDLAQQTAPQGRHSISQGNALGHSCERIIVALKGRHSLCGALSRGAGYAHSNSWRGIGESHPVGVRVFARSTTQGSAALRPGLWNYAALRLRAHPTDAPTIGLILCQDRNRVVAEYALRGMTQPIGISEYELTRVLPRELRSSLPSIDEIEAELSRPAANAPAVKRRPLKKTAKRKAAQS